MKANFNIEKARNTLIEAAKAAGEILKEKWVATQNDKIEVEFKGTVDIVTEADKMAESAIIRIFEENTPDFAILAEESGDHLKEDATHRWVIDPLDGTTSFAHGHPFFSVSIALQDLGTHDIILACVYNPTLEELFFAERGKGATRNGNKIHVSKTTELINSLVSSGFPYDRRECEGELESNIPYFNSIITKIRGFRRNGSAALDLCYVACGRQDAYWEWKLKLWDLAAGLLIVEEAGGKVSDLNGNPIDTKTDRIHILASNGKIHDKIVQVFKDSAAKHK